MTVNILGGGWNILGPRTGGMRPWGGFIFCHASLTNIFFKWRTIEYGYIWNISFRGCWIFFTRLRGGGVILFMHGRGCNFVSSADQILLTPPLPPVLNVCSLSQIGSPLLHSLFHIAKCECHKSNWTGALIAFQMYLYSL